MCQAGLHNFINSCFWNSWGKVMMASSLCCSALTALCPVLPCECLLNSRRSERQNGALLPFLECIYWGATMAVGWTCLWVWQPLFPWQCLESYWTLWKSDFKENITWLELFGDADQSYSWQVVGNAFAPEPAAPFVTGQGRKRRCQGLAAGFRSCKFARCAKSLCFWLI